MKVIIEIPEKIEEYIKDYIPIGAGNNVFCYPDEIVRMIQNGTPIPDNATNKDVAELVWGFKPRENTCIIPQIECNGNPAECDGCRFDDWWNAPYKAESEDREIKSVFTAEERADILNAINEAFDQKNMNIDVVGFDDTNGVWLDVMITK